MSCIKQRTAGVGKLPTGEKIAYAERDTDPEIKQRILDAIPEEQRDWILAVVKGFKTNPKQIEVRWKE